jgi:hypothetical protein
MCHKLGTTIIVACIFCTFGFADDQPDSAEYYYFIKEYNSLHRGNDADTIAEIIEICTTEDSIATPTGFTAISLASLHSKNLLSCTESMEAAIENNDYDDDLTDGYYKISWINRTYYYGMTFKKVYCGSKTSRSWYMPGKNYLITETRYRPEHLLFNRWPRGSIWGYHWGWAKSHSIAIIYPIAFSWNWRQIGNHKWSSGGGSSQTQIDRYW